MDGRFIIQWDKDEPNNVIAYTNTKVDGDPDAAKLRAYDAYTTKPLGAVGGGPMLVFLKLHVDMYAGVAWNQKFGGAASGFVLSNANGTLSGAAVNNHVSTWDPGIGLRYQF